MTYSVHSMEAKAIFAGGCFWCMESDFEKVPGVRQVVSGYTGGSSVNPTYRNYQADNHIEAVKIYYDSSIVDYRQLLEIFWKKIDPTDSGGQFCDRGYGYSSAIFYLDDQQRELALASKTLLEQSKKLSQSVVTPIVAANKFYPAEDYHQGYYQKNPIRYKFYRYNCGRDARLKTLWGDLDKDLEKKSSFNESSGTDSQGFDMNAFSKPSQNTLREKLTPMQYKVTQQEGTEPPFKNPLWGNKQEGVYVDIVSGEPLFSSTHKYDSGTGWPSFTQPLQSQNIVLKKDRKFFIERTEVRSKYADSHLGHLFNDGPEPTGKRYCINSASLRFIPKEQLEQQGYAAFLSLF